MRRIALALIAVAVVVSGCSQIMGNQTPEEQLKSQFQDAATSEYHVEYEVEANLDGMGSILSGAIESPEIYKQGENSKIVGGIAGVNFAVYDAFDSKSVVCTEGSFLEGLGEETGSQLECELSEDTGTQTFEEGLDDSLDEVNITVEGEEEYAGRSCTLYEVTETEELNDSVESEAVSQYSDSTVQFCLDDGKGYPAMFRVEVNESSELRDSDQSTALEVRVAEYDTDFSDVNFEVPLSTGVSATCDPFQANVSVFDYEGDVTVSVNGKNSTEEVSENSVNSFDLDEENRVDGSNTVDVYANGEQSSATCYHYESSFDSSDYDYDY